MSKHSEMLEKHACDLMKMGQTTEAQQVVKVLREVRRLENDKMAVSNFPPGALGSPSHQHSANWPPVQAMHPPSAPSNHEMLAMRMRWTLGHGNGFAHIDPITFGEEVHVLIITKDGEDVIIRDDLALYPSDALITKLRMLQSSTS